MKQTLFPMGLIELEEMEFYAYHGCFKEEQLVGNKFVVSISYSLDCNKAILSDSILDTVNYVQIFNIVKREMEIKSHLLEHVAGRIMNGLLIDFPQIDQLIVKVSKLNPPVGGQMKYVGVTLKK